MTKFKTAPLLKKNRKTVQHRLELIHSHEYYVLEVPKIFEFDKRDF
jgi:hypothetical protein